MRFLVLELSKLSPEIKVPGNPEIPGYQFPVTTSNSPWNRNYGTTAGGIITQPDPRHPAQFPVPLHLGHVSSALRLVIVGVPPLRKPHPSHLGQVPRPPHCPHVSALSCHSSDIGSFLSAIYANRAQDSYAGPFRLKPERLALHHGLTSSLNRRAPLMS